MEDKTTGLPVLIEPGEQHRVLEFYFNITPIGISIMDDNGYLVRYNAAFSDSLGIPAAESEPLHYSDFTCPLFLPMVDQYFRKLVGRQIESCGFRKQYFTQSGHSRDVDVNCIAFFDPTSAAVRYVSFYQYCSPFWRWYLPMLHSGFQKLLRLNTVPGIFISDEDGILLYCSSYASNLLGYSEQEIIKSPLSNVIDAKQAEEMTARLIDGGLVEYMKGRLMLQHRNTSTLEVDVEISIDDTDFFKNGRLQIIVFRADNRGSAADGLNDNPDLSILLSEVRQLKALLHGDREAVNYKSDSAEVKLSDYSLSVREKEILLLFQERKNAKEIAFELGLAEITIRKYLTNLYRKFNVTSREDLLLLFYGKTFI